MKSFKEFYTGTPATITEESAQYYWLRNDFERLKSLCHRAKTDEERFQAIMFGLTIAIDLELEKARASKS